jgi:hypothetical protein
MNQTSRDIQYNLVPHHPIHTQNNIYSLTFQDDKDGKKHSPDKLKHNSMNHTISHHSASGHTNGIRCLHSPQSKLSLLRAGWAYEVM